MLASTAFDSLAIKLEEWGIVRGDLLQWAILLLLFAIMLKLLQVLLSKRRRGPGTPGHELAIRLADLPDDPPPSVGDVLELYHIPVRVSAVIVAPAGSLSTLPESDEGLIDILEQIVPKLGRLAMKHGATIYREPAQLSVTGFSHALFRQLALPSAGKRTEWSIVAGPAVVDESGYVVGLVLRSADPNSYGCETATSETDWRRVFTIRRSVM